MDDGQAWADQAIAIRGGLANPIDTGVRDALGSSSLGPGRTPLRSVGSLREIIGLLDVSSR